MLTAFCRAPQPVVESCIHNILMDKKIFEIDTILPKNSTYALEGMRIQFPKDITHAIDQFIAQMGERLKLTNVMPSLNNIGNFMRDQTEVPVQPTIAQCMDETKLNEGISDYARKAKYCYEESLDKLTTLTKRIEKEGRLNLETKPERMANWHKIINDHIP